MFQARLLGLGGESLIDQGQATGDSVGLSIIAEGLLKLGDVHLQLVPRVDAGTLRSERVAISRNRLIRPWTAAARSFWAIFPRGQSLATSPFAHSLQVAGLLLLRVGGGGRR